MSKKFLIFLVFVTIWTLTTSHRLQRYERKCVKETGVNRKFIQRNNHNTQLLLYNPSTRCYVACVLRSLGTIKKNGHFNIKKAAKNIPKDFPRRVEVLGVYKRCAQKRGGNACQTTFQIVKCVLEDKVIRDVFYPMNLTQVPEIKKAPIVIRS